MGARRLAGIDAGITDRARMSCCGTPGCYPRGR
jgi:hypothetical protein